MSNIIYPYGFTDWSLFFIYVILLFLCVAAFRESKAHISIYKKYFAIGFFAKVIGGVLFALVFMYYYGFGDTFLYYFGGKTLAQTVIEDPTTYFRLLNSQNGALPPDLQEFASRINYSRTKEEWFMVKLISPICLISFNSYLVTTLFMSFISFFGSWKLFRVFSDIFPERDRLCFIIVFLLPSTLFWGSGILKDTITMTSINILIYCCYFWFFKGQFKSKYLLYMGIAIYFLVMLKLYILLSFLPALAMGIYNHFKNRVNSSVINFTLRPFLIVGLIFTTYWVTLNLGEINKKYALEGLEQQARGFHTWHVTTGGSAYTLGEIEYTPVGVIKKIPAALNVTFFRPYVWESRSPIMLIGAVESMYLFALCLYAIWLWGYKIIRPIRKDSLLLMLMLFILIFGFAIGFTSYNFGALARYKIPISSLVFFVVFYIIHVKRQMDEEAKAKVVS